MMTPMILGGQLKKQRNPLNSHQKQKHPAINSTSLVILVIGYIIFLTNYPSLPL
jgi:hypothetical protein